MIYFLELVSWLGGGEERAGTGFGDKDKEDLEGKVG